MKLEYRYWYRQNGVRYFDKFFNPVGRQIEALPKSSIYHNVPSSEDALEINAQLPIFAGYQKKIQLEVVSEYVKADGPVRKPMFQLKERLRPWIRKHLSTWELKTRDEWLRTTSPEILQVVHYGYLSAIYRYLPLIQAPYHKWENLFRTVWTNVAEIAKKSDRYQFVPISIPHVLQGRTLLDKYSTRIVDNTMISLFGEGGTAGFNQLDFWKFLTVEHRARSLLSLIPRDKYAKVVFLLTGTRGDTIAVNLAYLNSWIKGQPNLTEFGSVVSYPPLTVQKGYLKACMGLNALVGEDDFEGALVTKPAPVVQPTAEIPEDPDADEAQADVEDDTTDPDDEHEPSGLKPGMKEEPANAQRVPKVIEVNEPKIVKPVYDTKALLADLDKDIEALDKLSLQKFQNKGLSLKDVAPEEAPGPTHEQVKAEVSTKLTPAQQLRKTLNKRAEVNLVTAAEYRRLEEAIQKYEASEDPYGTGKTRVEAMTIKPEDVMLDSEATTIPVGDEVPDKTMAQSSLLDYDARYIDKTMKKHVLKVIDAVQAEGIIIRRHEVETKHTVSGGIETHTLELKPVNGKSSVIHFSFPVVDDEGVFEASGTRYFLRKQIVDAEIRKISPTEVALSSYYGKCFVTINPKASNNANRWIISQVNLAVFDEASKIQTVTPGNAFDPDVKVPYIFGVLASDFEEIALSDKKLCFGAKARADVNPELLKLVERNGRRWCGWDKKMSPIVVDENNDFFVVSKTGEAKLGQATDVFGIDPAKMPSNFAEMSVYSKKIPLAIALSYYLGFEAMLALLNVKYRVQPPRAKRELAAGERFVVFKDKAYIFEPAGPVADLVLAGFKDYEKALRGYDADLLNHKDVYLNLLATKGMSAIYLSQLDSMGNAFVDPISAENLERMGEPTTFNGLLLRSCELLTSYNHPRGQAGYAMKYRGYERFAGTLYRELMVAIRKFKSQNMTGRGKINISPYQVWNAILSDAAGKIVEDVNPVQNLKEQEIVTFSGTGGRSKETMTKPTRGYDKDNIGVMSQDTVDNSGTGTVAYLSSNPQIDSVYGQIKKDKVLNPSTILSTPALLSPCSSNDIGKRISFIGNQLSHAIASDAYRQPYVNTGEEVMVAKRTGKLFSTAAREDGKVVSVDEKGMVIEYVSGKRVGIPLGRQYGKAEGTTYPHDIIAVYQAGEKFKRGDVVAYNTKFFEPDFLDPKVIRLKINKPIVTAFLETDETHEDSCAISEKVGGLFTSEVVKQVSYVVEFPDAVLDVKKVGSQVNPGDHLLIMTDDTVSTTDNYSEHSIEVLADLAKNAPKVSYLGKLEKIEVFYHGDKEDMSPTLRKLVNRTDSELIAARKAIDAPVYTARVGDEHRVNGTPLNMGQAEIRFSISVKGKTGVGDKGVFTHQMKSTVAEVVTGGIHADDGQEIDALFSYTSLAARGVLSPVLVGTTISLLDHIGRQAASIYFGEST